MTSHVALKLVNGRLKFTITKNGQLTSFKLFDVAHLCLTVYIEPRYGTVCFLINSDVIGTVEMGHRIVCFDVGQREYVVM